MKTFILTLIAACIVMITSADGVTLDQLRKAGRKARTETNEALQRGERVHFSLRDAPAYRMLKKISDSVNQSKENEIKQTKVMIHKLKLNEEFFGEVLTGNKTFEVRRNDRDYKVGDWILLQSYCPLKKQYTGGEVRRKITYILQGGNYGVEEGFVVLGIK